jgi:hypothetical protein
MEERDAKLIAELIKENNTMKQYMEQQNPWNGREYRS